MSAPDELKSALWSQFSEENQLSFYSKVDAAFDAGSAAGGGSGGFSQEQLDQAVAQAKADLKAAVLGALPGVVDLHDADTATDEVLKASLVAAVEAL